MKKSLAAFCLLVLTACQNNTENNQPASENDVDAARNFIRAALDGDYKKAKTFMLQDSVNVQLLSTFEDNYQKNMSREDKRAYREASIRIPDVRKVNDSVRIVTYSNSYKNKPDSLKVVRSGKEWLVDFKYSFLIKDSLP